MVMQTATGSRYAPAVLKISFQRSRSRQSVRVVKSGARLLKVQSHAPCVQQASIFQMKEVVLIAQKASINQAWNRAHALTAQREKYHQSLLRRLARSATMVCTKIVLVPVPVKNARQECTKKNKLLTQVQIIIVIFALSDSTRSKKNRPRAFHATQVVTDS